MKRSAKYGVLAVAAILISATVAVAAPTKGVPPFQSFGGGPDVINLGNLNVHYSFPVFSRAGRGIPFSYALAYDTSVWTPAGSAWIFSGANLVTDIAAAVGAASVRLQTAQCVDHNSGQLYYYNIYWFQGYWDSTGTGHPFSQVAVNDNDGTCGATPKPTATIPITDGSGITLNVSDGPAASATLRSGEVIQVPVSISGVATGPTVQTDSNGNKITSSTTSGVTSFYDTLSSTTRALQISGTAPSPVSYTYTNASGSAISVVVSYVTYSVQTAFGCSGINEYGPISNALVDKITLPDTSYYQFAYEPTPGVSGKVTGRISSVHLPTGGTISYTYQGGDTSKGIFCADGSTAGFDRTTSDGTWQYRRVAGASPAYTTTITSPPDPVSGQNNQTVINFLGEFETQRKIYQGAATGTPLETLITCYNGNTTNCTTTTITTPFSQITKFTQFNAGSQARVDTFLNGYGLTTKRDEYDFGAGTFTRETTITYASLGNGILDHPASVVVTDGSLNLKSKTTYAYGNTVTATSGTPNHVNVTGDRGNLITLTNYSTATLIRSFKYYDTGTVYQSQDVNGQWTTYTYGQCGNSFVSNVSKPLSLSTAANWNCTGGVPTSVTDENGNVTSTDFTFGGADPFWRAKGAIDALGNETYFGYQPNATYSQPLAFSALTFGSSIVAHYSYGDGLGRKLNDQIQQGPSSTTFDTTSYSYDSFGRPKTASVPCAVSYAGTCPTAAATTTYDALNRPLTATDAGGGTSSNSYSLNDVLITRGPAPTGENSKRRQMQYDGLGRLSSVCEITSASGSGNCNQAVTATGFRTSYTYDAVGRLTNVSQNAQGTAQTRTYAYDLLGRLTSETNPESGATNYTYDTDSTCSSTSAGDMIKRVDAAGRTTCYYYDVLHRLSAVNYPTGCSRFVYDAATVNGVAMQNAKGRLAEASTDACAPPFKVTDEGFSYSKRGEPTDLYQSTPHSGGYYHFVASYWQHGVMKTISSPTTGYYMAYGVDGEGRPYSATDGAGVSPVSSVTYATSGTNPPVGSLTQVTYGSGDSNSFGYDSLGRMASYTYNVNGQAIVGSLTWNGNGTLKKLQVTDPVNSANAQTCTYAYDDLVRVSSDTCTGSLWGQNFTYDAFGNDSKTVPTGYNGIAFQPTYSGSTNRFTSIPGASVSYDATGNLTADGSHTYTWNADGRPLTVDSVNITYDALGRVVEQARGTTYIEFAYDPTGRMAQAMTGQSPGTAIVALPGGGKALYASQLIYRHADWLGTSRLATTSTRSVYYDGAYAPFGENYAGSGTTDLDFTGEIQNTVSGLYDFPFREYSPVQGRWISPDPAGLAAVDPADPQSWNRYAYVGNIPTGAIDPLGLWRSDAFGGGICIEGPWSCAAFATNYVNGIQVSAATAASLLGMGAAVNVGALSTTGFNTGRDGNSYAYTITATALGVGFDYFGLGSATAASELGLPTDLAVVGRTKNPTGPNTPGTYPRLLFGTRGLKCDGKPERIVATLASTNSNAPPSQYANSFLRASASATPGYAGNKSLTLNGSAVTSMFGNQFIQSITVSSYTTISVDWTISTIKHPSIVISETQVAECGF